MSQAPTQLCRACSILGGRRLCRVLGRHLRPRGHAVDEVAHHAGHVARGDAHLAGGVALAQGDGVIADGVIVHGDGKGHAQLVGPGIPLANAGAGGVHDVGHLDAGERSAEGPRALVKLGLLQQWEDGALGGRNQRLEGKDALVLVVLARVEGVLEHAVDDAADAKGRLNDGGRERAAALLLRDLLNGHVLGTDLDGGAIHRQWHCGAALQLSLQLERVALAQRLKRRADRLGVLLEVLAQALLVGLDLHHLHHAGLRELLVRGQVYLGGACVRVEVEGGAVGQANALNPAVRALHLAIPTVRSVVRHLML
mmetsp:Transcript_45947/g.117490  ORF Transcript_45947/g.117490 Transcript_45947/m.117490 type:complete len:311 (+) Transcript_45947:101-1033(+)